MSAPPTNSDSLGTPAGGSHGGGSWVRPVALVLSCLVLGFVGGWILRGDDGPVTILPPAAPADTGAAATVTDGTGVTAPQPTTAPEPPPAPPDRGEITLAVLNATDVSGLAARTAAQAESLGYVGVATGNAPATSSPSVAYFAPGQRPAARRVARDLQVGEVQPLPASGALVDAAPDGAEVVLVLGPG